MKKTLSLIIMLISLYGLQAQITIANSNFEDWLDGNPVNWTVDIFGTLTGSYDIPVEVHFGHQSTNSHGGYSAVCISSADVTSTEVSYTMNLPGFLQAGESEAFTVPFNEAMEVFNTLQDSAGITNILGQLDSLDIEELSTFFKILSKGVPCDSTPESVSAWVKYFPEEGDQMAMFVMTKKEGVLVDYAYQLFVPEDRSQYTQIGVELNTPGAICDSILVILVSSTLMNSSSVLYVDDVDLRYRGTGIENHDNFPGKVWPNPATDRLYIHPYNDMNYEWTLTDMTGKTLLIGKADGDTSIGTGNCAPGIYLLRIDSNGMSDTRKIIIH